MLTTFNGATGPGSYAAVYTGFTGSAPDGPDHLTIQNVAALLYTFSNTGPDPYSFSFLELSPVNTTGAFAIAPFQVDGHTFTRAMHTTVGGADCFVFGSAGATLLGDGSCGIGAFPPEAALLTAFDGATGPGSYTAVNYVSSGIGFAAPNHLTIEALSLPVPPVETPEPSGLMLALGGLGVLAVSARRRRRRC